MKYKAFISYSHKDSTWGDWLHNAIETFKVPKSVIDKNYKTGKSIPDKIFPVFRDREELPTSYDLGSMITRALEESEKLIVICSRNSAKSKWVNEEIITYKQLGRGCDIIPLVVDGEPNQDNTPSLYSECLPEAIKYNLGSNGRPDHNSPLEIDFIDAKESGDGKKRSLIKLYSKILDLPYEDLYRVNENRRRIRLNSFIVITLTILSLFTYLAVNSVINNRLAKNEMIKAKELEAEAQKKKIEAEKELEKALKNEEETVELFNIVKENLKETKENRNKALLHEYNSLKKYATSLVRKAQVALEKEDYYEAVKLSYRAGKISQERDFEVPELNSVLSNALENNSVINRWESGSEDSEILLNKKGDKLLVYSSNEDFIKVYSVPSGELLWEVESEDYASLYWINDNDFITVEKYRWNPVVSIYSLNNKKLVQREIMYDYYLLGSYKPYRINIDQPHIYFWTYNHDSDSYSIEVINPKDNSNITLDKEYIGESVDLFTGEVKHGFYELDKKYLLPLESNNLIVVLDERENNTDIFDLKTGNFISTLEGSSQGFDDYNKIVVNDDNTLLYGQLKGVDYSTIWSLKSGRVVVKENIETNIIFTLGHDGTIYIEDFLGEYIQEEFGKSNIVNSSFNYSYLHRSREKISLTVGEDFMGSLQYKLIPEEDLELGEGVVIDGDISVSENGYICSVRDDFVRVHSWKSPFEVTQTKYDTGFKSMDNKLKEDDFYILGKWHRSDNYFVYNRYDNKLVSTIEKKGETNIRISTKNYIIFYNPNSDLIVFGSSQNREDINRNLEFYSMFSGEHLYSIDANLSKKFDFILHPDKRYALLCTDNEWSLIDLTKEKPKVSRVGSRDTFFSPKFIVNRNIIMTFNFDTLAVEFYSLSTGELERSIDVRQFKNYPMYNGASNTGRYFYLGDKEGINYLFDLDSNKPINLNMFSDIKKIIFSPDDNYIYIIDSNYVHKVESSTFNLIQKYEYNRVPEAIIDKPDNSYILLINYSKDYESESREIQQVSKITGNIIGLFKGLDIDLNGKLAIIKNDNGYYLFNLETGISLKKLPTLSWANIGLGDKYIIGGTFSTRYEIPIEDRLNSLLDRAEKSGIINLRNEL